MGFVTGSSCYLHSALFSAPSSQCSSHSAFSFSSTRFRLSQGNKRRAMACLQPDNPKDIKPCKKRAILFMGLAVLPFLNGKTEALEAGVQNQKQNDEQSSKGSQPQNPFFSLLNALGFLGSGVLAALYASTLKEKANSDEIVESMKYKLKEKETEITSLQKKFEADILKEKEVHSKALAKANEEKTVLVNKLNLADGSITNIGQELQKERKLVEELTFRADSSEASFRKVGSENMKLHELLKEKLHSIAVLQETINALSSEIKGKEESILNLNSKLADKESEISRLSSVHQKSQERITVLDSDIEKYKDLILKNVEELELKNDKVHNLNTEITSLLSEKNHLSQKLDATVSEYQDFKASAEKKANSDSSILGERAVIIDQLKEQLKSVLDEVNRNEALIADLNQEKVDLIAMLNIELKNVKNIEHELKITQENLVKSEGKASDLEKQADDLRGLCSELEAEVSRVHVEFLESKESLQRRVDEANGVSKGLAEELKFASGLLKKSNEELRIVSEELGVSIRKSDILEKELFDAREKVEITSDELKEEKKLVASLNKELEILETQLSNDKEGKRSLEIDLEEATKSLNEMNRNALMLSRELDLSNSRISSLEGEKDALFRSLNEQKEISQEARENLEDAHNLVMRLGKERESFENRGKKLEEELASAKGEILRMKSVIKSAKVKTPEEEAVPVKKVTRRRKVVVTPQQEDS